jgi:glycosyltransferase involved in cell wall biosynthesis
MRCPTLNELPPPPPDKTGWPWTTESEQLPETMPDGSPWPRVSIVTPSYNQAQFIEETIRSVLLQGYPDLEYIIIDGGSTDGSVEIIRKYDPWLAYWVSERDEGQSEAINKGWQRASGKVLAWLNSDDTYEPDALGHTAKAFLKYPEAILVYGKIVIVDQQGEAESVIGGEYSGDRLVRFWRDGFPGISQPASFFHSRILTDVGMLNEQLNYLMDYDYFLRADSAGSFCFVDQRLARFRLQDSSKTSSGWFHFIREYIGVATAYVESGGEYAYPSLVEDVRHHYASLLISMIAEGRLPANRAALSLLLEAFRNDPALLKKRWIAKLAIKTLLGPRLTAVLKSSRVHSEDF